MAPEIVWTNEIGIIEDSDICSRRAAFWMRLDNGQSAQVAEVHVTVNPFWRTADGRMIAVCVGTGHRLSQPGVQSVVETRAYAEAAFVAGRWLGEWLGGLPKEKE